MSAFVYGCYSCWPFLIESAKTFASKSCICGAERRCRDEVGVGTLAEAAAAHRPDLECSECGARGAWRDGSTAAGVPRWRCRCCGRRVNPPTGIVLEHCRKPLSAWVTFFRLMRHNVPVECAAELCGVTHKTAFEWRHRVLATVSGYQDRIVLRDTAWVDETYINDTDLSKGYGQARKRGPFPKEVLHLRRYRRAQDPVRGHLQP